MAEPVKSSFCTGGECIEVRERQDGEAEARLVLSRKMGTFKTMLFVTRAEFTAFVRGVKAGEFDRFIDVPEANPAVYGTPAEEDHTP